VGTDDDGRTVGVVAFTVWAGGGQSAWVAWRSDGTPEGVRVGEFESAEAAMVATDEAG
jgi:hypothetical protein